jgi:DNA-binding response OmpR family regulator
VDRKSNEGGTAPCRFRDYGFDMRVLIVEDEHGLAGAVQIGLARDGYAADVALTRSEAESKLAVTAYDLLLLDVTLPDGNGLELAAAVRSGETDCLSGHDVRILMLTARGGLADRVRGLDAGADDYLVKPFALEELTARIRALLRREVSGTSTVLRAGELTLDTARQLAHRGGRELTLTLKEFAVLRYLMTRPGHVVSSEELLEHVWDENADPFTETVRVTVGTLRRKLTLEGEEPALETVIGRGYRLRDEPLQGSA